MSCHTTLFVEVEVSRNDTSIREIPGSISTKKKQKAPDDLSDQDDNQRLHA